MSLYVPGYRVIYLTMLAVVLGLALMLARERGLPLLRFYLATLCIVLFALVGGRLYAVYRDAAQLGIVPTVDALWGSGTGSSGVYLGGIVGAWLGLRWMRLDTLRALDVYAPPMALAVAVGRIGCFIAGCCYGTVCHAPWGVRFPAGSPAHLGQLQAELIDAHAASSLPVHPTQLYEAAFALFAFVLLMWLRRRVRIQGMLFFGYLAGYAAFRFWMEFLRGDYRPMLADLTVPQVVFAGVFVFAALGLYLSIARASEGPQRGRAGQMASGSLQTFRRIL